MSKAHIETALVALAAFMVVAAIQRHVTEIPVVGPYLPQ